MTNSNRALIVLTSHNQLGSTGKATGAYLSEISHVYWTLVDAGIAVDFVSPRGGAAPLDGVTRDDRDNARFLDSADAMHGVKTTLRPDDVDPTLYAVIYYAGGHGTMWDFPDDVGLARIAAAIYDEGGIVAAVCHGPSALVNIRLSSGAHLVDGKDLAAFTNDEEAAVKLTDVVPFLLADVLVARGARHLAAPNFAANVVTSERLITGQNPASARGVGKAIVAALASQPAAPGGHRLRGSLTTVLLATLVGCAGTTGAQGSSGGGGKGDLSGTKMVLTGFEQPEAVEWDDNARAWYVSNFGGAPQLDGTDRDGDGFISRITENGSSVELEWLTGFDAPKGMRLVGRTLYIVDVQRVVAVDVEARQIIATYPVADSTFLNDLDIAADGSVYVTDTLANRISRIDPGSSTVATIASGPQLINPNGLRVEGDHLVVAGWGPITDPATFATSRPGDLYTLALAGGAQTTIASQVGNLDGLALTAHGYLVTSWAGTVLEVDSDGRVAALADGFHTPADVTRGRDALAVPDLLEGTVTLIPQ